MQKKGIHIIQSSLKKWRWTKAIEALLLSSAIGGLFWTLTTVLGGYTVSFLLGILSVLGLANVIYWGFMDRSNLTNISTLLNEQFPELEHSTDLLLKEKEALPLLKQFQFEKIDNQLVDNGFKIAVTNKIQSLSLFALMSLALFGWAKNYQFKSVDKQIILPPALMIEDSLIANQEVKMILAKMLSAVITYTPPNYTTLPTTTAKDWELTVPENSKINWQIQFNQPLEKAIIQFQDGRKLALQPIGKNRYEVATELTKNGFYFLQFQGKSQQLQTSDYFKITIVKDLAPDLAIKGLEPFAEYIYNPNKTISFETAIKDDYGIAMARIITTLTKGEGEAVKFRNDTLTFKEDFKWQRKELNLPKTLVLKELGMELGDELYLHVEAIDNKQPIAQITRTAKFIIAFQDTVEVDAAQFGGLAVNRMPAYFRSQRQIIIDTENLIAQKDTLSTERFKELANNIGIDQKILRLRYGQFLGEEFETNTGAVAVDIEEEHDHEAHEGHDHNSHEGHDHDLPDGHKHETAEEHQKHLETEKKAVDLEELGHNHDHDEVKNPNEKDATPAWMETYAHLHDNVETANFFDEATASKLRAALSVMWDSEIQLRTGSPEKALPYEYKALKLIKEIQQSSRVYVERVGFEPPLIKVAEKRLTGELEDILEVEQTQSIDKELTFPAIEKSILLLENLKRVNRLPVVEEQLILQKAGEEVAALTIQQSGSYFATLQRLKAVNEGIVPPNELIVFYQKIQADFYQILPRKRTPDAATGIAKGNLSKLFLEEMSKG